MLEDGDFLVVRADTVGGKHRCDIKRDVALRQEVTHREFALGEAFYLYREGAHGEAAEGWGDAVARWKLAYQEGAHGEGAEGGGDAVALRKLAHREAAHGEAAEGWGDAVVLRKLTRREGALRKFAHREGAHGEAAEGGEGGMGIVAFLLLELLLALLAHQQFGIGLEVAVGGLGEQMSLTVDEGVDGLVAEHGLAERLVALLHGAAERGVLEQPLPHGRRGVVAGPFVAPGFGVVGIGEVAVAVGEVIVPHGAGDKLAAAAVTTLAVLVEVGAALIAVGVEAELGVDEIVHERGHVDVAGIAFHGVGKRVGLYHLFDGVHIALDIVELFGLELFLFRIDARPDDLAGHDAFADARDLGAERGVVVAEGVDAQQVAARQVAPAGVAGLHGADVHAFLAAFDGFAEDVDAAVVAIDGELAHHGARSPVAHVAPQLEGQRVAQHRDVVVGGEKHPVAVGGHAEQADGEGGAVVVARLERVFLLVEG